MDETRLPDDAWLRQQAGEGAFKRGVDYFKQGAVALTQVSGNDLAGEAYGSETYRLWFKQVNGDWRWGCDCPAADGGMLCKHLVAAVLTARALGAVQVVPEDAPPERGRRRAADGFSELSAFLRMQTVERLADWLLALAREDRGIEKRLLLHRAASEPGAMQDALSSVLATGGFMDYRRTLEYARRLAAAIAQLEEVLLRDPVECRALCEYALKRLFKIVERVDDSAGAVGGCMADIAHLHARACKAAPPGKPLAKALWALQEKDEWRLLEIADYWEVLGAQGQAAYSKLALDAFEKLPSSASGEWGAHLLRNRVEALARCTRDFDLLQRVLRRDLSHPRNHLRVLESLHEFGRAREALAFAEASVKRFPKDAQLRAALARCLADAGLGDEALEQLWAAFVQRPDGESWDALKQCAGKDWPRWREKALAHATEKDGAPVSLRVLLLAHDGALADAIALARSKPVDMFALHKLADRARAVDPAAAAEFYLRLARPLAEQLHGPGQYKDLVSLLQMSAKCATSKPLRDFVAEVRAAHARKSRLMAMLDAAGM
ncbi:MAG: hypothetical protein QM612_10580 [Thermomonas sp.]|uniref:SWIM zinc finger family protein n=1 Tax=Thermomonas sp. TaxID=1971895 RepID=UPI0039E310DB